MTIAGAASRRRLLFSFASSSLGLFRHLVLETFADQESHLRIERRQGGEEEGDDCQEEPLPVLYREKPAREAARSRRTQQSVDQDHYRQGNHARLENEYREAVEPPRAEM